MDWRRCSTKDGTDAADEKWAAVERIPAAGLSETCATASRLGQQPRPATNRVAQASRLPVRLIRGVPVIRPTSRFSKLNIGVW